MHDRLVPIVLRAAVIAVQPRERGTRGAFPSGRVALASGLDRRPIPGVVPNARVVMRPARLHHSRVDDEWPPSANPRVHLLAARTSSAALFGGEHAVWHSEPVEALRVCVR